MDIKNFWLAMIFFLASMPVMSEVNQPEETDTEQTGKINNEGSHKEGEEGTLKMDLEKRRSVGIMTDVVKKHALAEEILAPGEVVLNTYLSSKVSPRISGQIVARHTRLGDTVKKGQRMVTLSSVEMAQAQGDLVVATREWQRVKKLGPGVIAERRYVEAQVAYQQFYAKVLAFGMTSNQVANLLKQSDASKATGSFDLLAPQDGVVIRDDFIVGEVIEPGRVLFDITDESRVWIEARLRSEETNKITTGTTARIISNSGDEVQGKVIQVHHMLDETTRTRSVRIEVDKSHNELHPGQFVEVAVKIDEDVQSIAVPKQAIVLMEGAATVFTIEGNEIRPKVVETGEARGQWTQIITGLSEGEEIVTQGAFVIKSLLLKSQMGEGH
ncbi:MAG: efflux RND transporter periplasmic adaptor subunit [Gammaproteobacteria bacterium]